MKFTSLFATCLLLSTAALAETTAETMGVNSVTGAAPTTQDFVTEAAVSDMFELKESKLAEQRGDAATKAFAARMVTDHTKTSHELQAMLPNGVTPPTSLDDAHQQKLDKLSSLNGADFDRQYRTDQVSAHETAVSLFTRYSKGGETPALKQWAGKTLPTLQEHLNMANDLKSKSA